VAYKFRLQSRKSLRLQQYNYSAAGYYFVTICTEGRLCLFGEIIDDVLFLNAAGEMVYNVLEKLPTYYSKISIDTFIVMPNHVHVIFIINDTGPTQRSAPSAPGMVQDLAVKVRCRLS